MIFNLEDKFNCSNVCGSGGSKLKPYFSHYLNDSDKSLLALVDLNMRNDFVSPYTRKDFIFTWENCYENFEVNSYLLNCFHDDIRNNIEIINNNATNIKKLIKEKRK